MDILENTPQVFDVSISYDFSYTPACESAIESSRGFRSHNAQWFATFTCGCSVYLCNRIHAYVVNYSALPESHKACSLCGFLNVKLASSIRL